MSNWIDDELIIFIFSLYKLCFKQTYLLVPTFNRLRLIWKMLRPLKLLCYYKKYIRQVPWVLSIMGIVVQIRGQLMRQVYWYTTLPTRLETLMRQQQSRLYLEHGVAGKEARCPSKQGEVSYSTSWLLNEKVLEQYIVLSLSSSARL